MARVRPVSIDARTMHKHARSGVHGLGTCGLDGKGRAVRALWHMAAEAQGHAWLYIVGKRHQRTWDYMEMLSRMPMI
jgi:hypothetical protein